MVEYSITRFSQKINMSFAHFSEYITQHFTHFLSSIALNYIVIVCNIIVRQYILLKVNELMRSFKMKITAIKTGAYHHLSD